MPGKTTIPRSIKGFNNFLIVTNAYLIIGTPVTNAVRLGWSVDDLAFWQKLQIQWSPLYQLYIDKKGGYTTDTKNDLMNLIADAVAYDKKNKIINKVKATPGLISIDCSTFNLPEKLSTTPTGAHPFATPHIAGKTIAKQILVYPKIISVVGGSLHIEGFADKIKSGHAHKPAGFDLLEYAIAVFYSGTANLPASAGDVRMLVDHSSKAGFVLSTVNMTGNLPILPAGTIIPLKFAVLFFRWAKSKHPELDGPWSGPFIVVLQ